MEENTTPTSALPNGKNLGIAGMILGIIAIIVSFIGCMAVCSILLAVVGLVLSAISMSQAKKAGASKGMAIAGLICSILAIIICLIWIFVFAAVVSKGADVVKEVIEHSDMLDTMSKVANQLKQLTDTVNVPHQ
ncbi:MAG: DUF4190 domain-containing protein [Bacteroidota bacterium]